MASRKHTQQEAMTRSSFAMSLNPEAYCKAVLGVDRDSRRFDFIKPWLNRLPEPWQVKCDDEQEVYFWNPESGKSTWDHPYAEAFLKLVKSFDRIEAAGPEFREQKIDDELEKHHIRLEKRVKDWREVPGDPRYFYHSVTKETRWDDPRTSVVSELNMVVEALTGLDDTSSDAEKAEDPPLHLEDGDIESEELAPAETVREEGTVTVFDRAQELARIDACTENSALYEHALSPKSVEVSKSDLGAGPGDVAEGATFSELDATATMLPIRPAPHTMPLAVQITPATPAAAQTMLDIPVAAQTMPAVADVSLDTVEADDAVLARLDKQLMDDEEVPALPVGSEKGASSPPMDILTTDTPPAIPTDPESLPVFRWMIPEPYLLHLGLECPRMACFLLLRPVVLLDLPLPWIAKLDQNRVYFVHRGHTIDSMSWRHPLERFFCTLLGVLRSHFSLTAMPLKDTLVTTGVKRSLQMLVETLGGFEDDFGQWTWEQNVGLYVRADGRTRTDDAVKSAQSEVIARLHALKLLWDHCVEDEHFPIPVNEWIQYAGERVRKSAVKVRPVKMSAVITSDVIQSLTFVYTRAIFCAMQIKEPEPQCQDPETPMSVGTVGVSIDFPPFSRCSTPSTRMEVHNDPEEKVAQFLLEEAYETSAPRVAKFIAEECARKAVTECSARALLWFRPSSPRPRPAPKLLPTFPDVRLLVRKPLEPIEFVTKWHSRAQKAEDVELETKKYLTPLYERCVRPQARGPSQLHQWAATLREKLNDCELDVMEKDASAPRATPWADVEVPDMPPTALRECIVWGCDEDIETTSPADKPRRRESYQGAALILPYENSPGCAARVVSPEGSPIPAYGASFASKHVPQKRSVESGARDELYRLITHARSRSLDCTARSREVKENVVCDGGTVGTPRSARHPTRIALTPRWPQKYRPLMTRKSILRWLARRKPDMKAAFLAMSEGQGRVTLDQYRFYCEQNEFPLDIDFSFRMLDIHNRGELTPFELLKLDDALAVFRADQLQRRAARTCVDDVYAELMFEIMEDESRKCTNMALTAILEQELLRGLRPPQELPPPEFFEHLDAQVRDEDRTAAQIAEHVSEPTTPRMTPLEQSSPNRSRAGSIQHETPRRPSTPIVERDVAAEFETLKRIYHSLSFQEQQILVRKLQPVRHHTQRRKPQSLSPSSTSRVSATLFQHIVQTTGQPGSSRANGASSPVAADVRTSTKLASQTAPHNGAETQAFTEGARQIAPRASADAQTLTKTARRTASCGSDVQMFTKAARQGTTPCGPSAPSCATMASQTVRHGGDAHAFAKMANQTAPCGAEAESPKLWSPARRASHWIKDAVTFFAERMTERETVLFDGILRKTLVAFIQGYATDHVARELRNIDAEEFRRSLPPDCRKIVKTQVFQAYAHIFRRPRSAQKKDQKVAHKSQRRQPRSPQMGVVSSPPTHRSSQCRHPLDDGETDLFPPEDIRVAPPTPAAPEPQISVVVDHTWNCDARNDDPQNRVCSDPEDVIEAGYESPMVNMPSPVSARHLFEDANCWTDNLAQQPPREQKQRSHDDAPRAQSKGGKQHHRLWSGKGPSAPHSFRERSSPVGKDYGRGTGLLDAAREQRRARSICASSATSPAYIRDAHADVQTQSASGTAARNSALIMGAQEHVDSRMRSVSPTTPVGCAMEVLSLGSKKVKHLRAAGSEGSRKPRGRQKPYRKIGAVSKKRACPLAEEKIMKPASRKGTALKQKEDEHSAKWYDIQRARLRADVHQAQKQFEEVVLVPQITGEPANAAVDELTRIYQDSLFRYSEVCDAMISEWKQC